MDIAAIAGAVGGVLGMLITIITIVWAGGRFTARIESKLDHVIRTLHEHQEYDNERFDAYREHEAKQDKLIAENNNRARNNESVIAMHMKGH